MSATEKRPWYGEGLPFACRGCGRCCRGPGGYVWVEPEEVPRLAETTGMTVDAFGKRYLRRRGMRLALVDGASGDCVFLDEAGRCTVYSARPVQCRTYPWWPEIVRCRESWEMEKETCPGIGRGEAVARERIEEQLAFSENGERTRN